VGDRSAVQACGRRWRAVLGPPPSEARRIAPRPDHATPDARGAPLRFGVRLAADVVPGRPCRPPRSAGPASGQGRSSTNRVRRFLAGSAGSSDSRALHRDLHRAFGEGISPSGSSGEWCPNARICHQADTAAAPWSVPHPCHNGRYVMVSSGHQRGGGVAPSCRNHRGMGGGHGWHARGPGFKSP